jgi:hypothetical protein
MRNIPCRVPPVMGAPRPPDRGGAWRRRPPPPGFWFRRPSRGTVLRAPTLARWAAAAGFADVEVLAIDNPFWRFYRLRG